MYARVKPLKIVGNVSCYRVGFYKGEPGNPQPQRWVEVKIKTRLGLEPELLNEHPLRNCTPEEEWQITHFLQERFGVLRRSIDNIVVCDDLSYVETLGHSDSDLPVQIIVLEDDEDDEEPE